MQSVNGTYADAYRFLDPAGLSVGQTFSIDLAVNFRSGFKGMDLRGASDETIFNFNVGGDDYAVDQAESGNGSIGNAYSNNTIFELAFTQTSAGGGTWSITRDGGVTDFDSGTYSGIARSIKLYIGGQGTAPEDDLYANNLAIVPEPAALALLGLGCVLLAGGRRRTP
ncbi:MAG: PEP-CTERM sorting domain-containing protein [Phycisphaerales bacterium]|nr:PEP-CTERM sorting domain-containing protein [Phycisphaerales bacterium]